MRHAYVITACGYTRVEVLDHRGDWAVTLHNGLVAMTHLPTGARVAIDKEEKREKYANVLPDLQDLERFDLQTFGLFAQDVRSVLLKHGIWQYEKVGTLVELQSRPPRKLELVR